MEGHISLTLRISILKPCDSMNCNQYATGEFQRSLICFASLLLD